VLALPWPLATKASIALAGRCWIRVRPFKSIHECFYQILTKVFANQDTVPTIPVLRLSVSLSKEVFLMRSDGMQIFYKKVYFGQIQASQIKALRHHSEQTCRPSSSPYTLPCFLPVDSSRASAYCARNTSNLLMVMATSKEKIQASHQKSSSQDYWLFRFLFQQAKELFQSKPQTKEREKIQISAGSEGSIGLSQSGVRK
jgi:hypothetical protein